MAELNRPAPAGNAGETLIADASARPDQADVPASPGRQPEGGESLPPDGPASTPVAAAETADGASDTAGLIVEFVPAPVGQEAEAPVSSEGADAQAPETTDAGDQASADAAPTGTLPDDLRDHPALRGKSAEAIARELVNAQALIGRKALTPPAEDADEATWAAYHQRTGCPEEADAYPQTVASDWRGAFFAAGLSARQAEVLTQALNDQATAEARETEAAQQRRAAEVQQTLAKAWQGQQAAKERALERAVRTLDLAPDALAELYSLGHAGQILNALAQYGEGLAETPVFTDGGEAPLSPQSALDALAADPEHVTAFLTPGHPQHHAARTRRADLLRQMQMPSRAA